MARSGDFGTSNQYIKYYIEAIQNWQDVAGNLSNVTVRVWVYRTNNYTTWGNGTVSVTINGGSYSASITTSQKITTTPIVVFERNLNIGHNADGTGYVDISAMISHNAPFSSGWNGWRMWLTTIPRASQPSLSNANVPMGTTITIYMNRKSTAFTHTVKYGFGNQGGTIATGVTDQVNWTVPMSLANAIPNATAGWGTITVETYNGGTYIGSASVRFDASVPDNIKPSLSGVSHSETVPNVSNLIGSYVQGLSKIRITIDGASGVYGSSIRSYTIRWENASSNSSSATFDVNNSGNHDIVAEVVDSRGRKTTKTITGINVLAYSPPRITEFKADRANSNGTLNQLGTYAKVTRTASVSSLKVGTTEKNTLTYTIKTKPKSSSTWTTNVSATTLATGVTTLTGSNTIGTFDATQSYDIRIEVSDKFNTVISIGTISAGQVTMSWGKNGVGIGKIWERGVLDVYGDVNVDGGITVTNGKKIVFPHLINGTTPVSPLGIATDGSAVTLTEGTDLNTVKTTGIYMCNNAVNRPSNIAGWVYIEVIQHNNSFLSQRVTSLWDGRVFQRVSTNNNWSAWKQYTTVESSGANANGNYIRYTDGMQICWLNRSFSGTRGMWSPAVGYPSGFYYMYMSGTWTFPASFSTPPATFTSGDIAGAMSETHTAFGASNSACSWEVGTFSLGGVDINAPALLQTFLAIGRWS